VRLHCEEHHRIMQENVAKSRACEACRRRLEEAWYGHVYGPPLFALILFAIFMAGYCAGVR
jgi:hypothetical protein